MSDTASVIDQALPARTRMGEFELLRVVGIGGFGIVYEARDHTLERRVAIKEYMPSSLASRGPRGEVLVRDPAHQAIYDAGLHSFVNEARLLARFDHPSLVKVHRFWQSNGTAYMVMPFHEGITLRQHLRTLSAPPDEGWLRGLLDGLTGALQVIHGAQCVHRDIAPDNILLLADGGRPLLLDFGAARLVIGDATQALTAILKPGYAPIEQYAEIPHLRQGPWTDVYALCAVVHTAITGHKPPPALGRMVRDDHRPLAPQTEGRAAAYSLALRRTVDAGLRPLPQDRPQDMAALLQGWGRSTAEPAPTLDLELDLTPQEQVPHHESAAAGKGRHTGSGPDPAAGLDLDLGSTTPKAVAGPSAGHRAAPSALHLDTARDRAVRPVQADLEATIRVTPEDAARAAARSAPGTTAAGTGRLARVVALLLAVLLIGSLAHWWTAQV